MSFSTAMVLVRQLEGGKVDNQATNCGMTQGTWTTLGLAGSVMDATVGQLACAYRQLWDALRLRNPANATSISVFEATPEPADAVCFQFYINVRVSEFIKAFQGAVGVRMDGDLGPVTWRKLEIWNGHGEALSERVLTTQHWLYQASGSPYKTELLNRVERVKEWLTAR